MRLPPDRRDPPPTGTAHRGRGGVPWWLDDTVRHCSRCGDLLDFGPVEGEERSRLVCPTCHFIAYVNPRLVVTTLPITADGQVILLRRGIEPGYGAWAQPGGFLEIDETAEEGAARETLEETGLVVEPSRVVGLYSRPPAAIVVVCYEARITGGDIRTGPEAIQIEPFAAERIPWPGIAFHTTTQALRDWIRTARPEPSAAADAAVEPRP
ncbi:MAG: NUDIX hydrolase [Chloroflexi bacterium]|nr:NUDIX hydrolase [Chloroflexota bacterium]MDQ3407332.1 NUDIX hydrolase [Chloroflexota bacterium]